MKTSEGMEDLLLKIKARIDRAEQVRKAGGNTFQQLEARLTDEDTGKLMQDIVITAIMQLKTLKDAKSFCKGYAKDIAKHPKKYPKQARSNPKSYAAQDIYLALNIHFTESKTHRLWNKVLPKKKKMNLFNQIKKKTRTGLAVLLAGAFLGAGSMAYAKEINNEGWPVPDETKYLKAGEEVEEFSCKYKNKDVTVEIKVESYANLNGQVFEKYVFEDKVFMYAILEPGEGHSFHGKVIMDRDGNGSLETLYDFVRAEDEEEFENDGSIPEWILEKVARKDED